MNNHDSRYGIYVTIIPYQEFEKNRQRLGLTAEQYLINLMGKDFTGKSYTRKIKQIDLNQTSIQNGDNV